MAPSSSKLYPGVAHQRQVLLEWPLPPKTIPPGGSQKACTVGMGMAPSSSKFTLGWLTKGLRRWNVTFLVEILPSGGSQKVGNFPWQRFVNLAGISIQVLCEMAKVWCGP